jgi:hypothetical protein
MTAEGHPLGAEAPPKPKRSRIKTWALWAIALLVGILGFSFGRMTSGIHPLPALAATLPGDEPEFNREIDERVRELFPLGTSDEKLIAYLSSQGFTPDWRKKDSANAATFVWSGLFCTKIVRVIWRADSNGALTAMKGSYEAQCVY